jgi:hypothetical protein
MTRKITTLLACACAALALAGAASADGPSFGVAEDAGKYGDDGGTTVFDALNDLGMTENRMWVFWDPAHPDQIVEKRFLDRALPEASAHNIRVMFSVSPLKARAITRSPAAETQFVDFLVLLARTYPQVKDIIVGNEPNQPRFWQPQFVKGKGVSGAAYEHLLARAYDALKAVDPTIRVIGVGLSPRGNDRPDAKNNISTSPVRFIHDMGVAYRRSGRNLPIMDLFGFHSYPRFDSDPLARGYAWPNAGITNLDRIKQAVWDAFHDTAQPVFAEPLAPDAAWRPTIRFALDEVGWQVKIPRSSRRAYTGRENVRGTEETKQASIYSQIVDIVACDPAVDSLLFFHLVDEHDLDRFQSGLMRADWTKRPSYDAVKSRIAQLTTPDGVRCAGKAVQWRHATGVAGATVAFGRGSFRVRATEEATYAAGFLPVDSLRGLSRLELLGLREALDRPRRFGPALQPAAAGLLRAYVSHGIGLSRLPLLQGSYVPVVRVSATMNPERASLFVGRAFSVG